MSKIKKDTSRINDPVAFNTNPIIPQHLDFSNNKIIKTLYYFIFPTRNISEKGIAFYHKQRKKILRKKYLKKLILNITYFNNFAKKW